MRVTAPPAHAPGTWSIASSRAADARRGVQARRLQDDPGIESPRFRVEDEHDLACVFYFLHRPLFAEIRRAVRPGGIFVAAIHVRSARDEEGRFLLEPGELRALFSDWEIVLSREGAAAESNHRHGTLGVMYLVSGVRLLF